MSNTFKRCKRCGKQVGVITRLCRNMLVDAEALDVKADPFGEIFIRVDGTKLRGREIKQSECIEEFIEYVVHGRPKKEKAYRPHRCKGNDL